MARVLLALAASLVALAWPASCQRLPVVAPVTKDLATSLYTLPFHNSANLVVGIAGPLVWSTCQRGHLPAELPCKSPTCRLANSYHDWHDDDKACTAYPYNPVTGACAARSLVHARFVAKTTDGRNPVSQVNVRALAACAPRKLLASLPGGSTGVAGLAGSGLALPAQLASTQNVAKKFLLCLPRPRGGTDGDGVAIFGGGRLHFWADPWTDYTPLLSKQGQGSPAHYISVKSISMENSRVPVSERVLATGGVMLSTSHEAALRIAPPRRVPPVRQGPGGAGCAGRVRGAVRAVLRRADAGQHEVRVLGAERHAGARRREGLEDDRGELDGGRRAGDGVPCVRGDEGGEGRRRRGARGDRRRGPDGEHRDGVRHGEEAARVALNFTPSA